MKPPIVNSNYPKFYLMKYSYVRMTVFLLFSQVVLLPSCRADELKLKKIDDRVVLYECASGLYLATMRFDFSNIAGGDSGEEIKGTRQQAAAFAFMFFVDRRRIHKDATKDIFGRGLASVTYDLMKKLDWDEFEEYMKKEGKRYADSCFINYSPVMFEEDLKMFKKFLEEPRPGVHGQQREDIKE